MHYATVPNAFDIAVLVSGDRDFVPALVRTRGKGKRVAVCSMRGSASYDYADPAANIKDFGVLWIDDHLDELVVPIHPSLLAQRPAMAQYLTSAVTDFVELNGGAAELDDVTCHLEQIALGDVSAHAYVMHEFGGLLPFVDAVPHALRLERRVGVGGAALFIVSVDAADDAPFVAELARDTSVGTVAEGAARVAAPAFSAAAEAAAGAAAEAAGAEAARAHEQAATGESSGSVEEVKGRRMAPPPPAPAPPPPAPPPPAPSSPSDSAAEVAAPTASNSGGDDDGAAVGNGSSDDVSSGGRSSGATASSASRRGSSLGGGGGGATGRTDGALIVDGSLLALLEADAFSLSDTDRTTDGASAARRLAGSLGVADLAELTMPMLKVELRTRLLSTSGAKPTLLRRLLDAINDEARATAADAPNGQAVSEQLNDADALGGGVAAVGVERLGVDGSALRDTAEGGGGDAAV